MFLIRVRLVFIFLILSSGVLWSDGFQIGCRGFISGGYPSGKGLWDWTDNGQEGSLFWGAGGGAGLVTRFHPGKDLILEAGISYVHATAGQKLDETTYLYSQTSLDFPLIIKTRLPFQKLMYLGAGPMFIFLPFDAKREVSSSGSKNSTSSTPDTRIMAALQAGLDYELLANEALQMLLSFNFIHPVTSPEYSWQEKSSGSIRINRLDLALTLLYTLQKDVQ